MQTLIHVARLTSRFTKGRPPKLAHAPHTLFPLCAAYVSSQNKTTFSCLHKAFARRWDPSIECLDSILTHPPTLTTSHFHPQLTAIPTQRSSPEYNPSIPSPKHPYLPCIPCCPWFTHSISSNLNGASTNVVADLALHRR